MIWVKDCCQPEKKYFTRWPIPLEWSAEQGKKKKSLAALPSPTPYIHEFYRGKTYHERKDFVFLGCGTYFIEDNTIQYSTVVIIYHTILHPMFTPDACLVP